MIEALILQVAIQGPILGGVSDSGVVVGCRAVQQQDIRVVYSTDPLLLTPDMTASYAPSLEYDWTLRVPLYGLHPETTYYYAVQAWTANATLVEQTPTRSFRTAPVPGTPASFTFVAFADAGEDPQSPPDAYLRAALDNPAFCVQLGDLDHRNPADQGAAPALSAWREMHRDQLGGFQAGLALQALAATAPLERVWDDHDFGANNACGLDPLVGLWKSRALRAHFEYFPGFPLPDQDHGIYRSWTYGQAEFFMLDCRWNRSPNLEPDTSAKTMLGPDQLAWLLAGLNNSTATWKFVLSSSVWNPASKPVDSWYLYQTEADEVRNGASGVPGIIWLTGDIHSGGAINVAANGWVELSIPATNIHRAPSGCSGGYGCGYWSEGVVDCCDPDGYAAVHVYPDKVVLEARAADGSLRISYEVQ